MSRILITGGNGLIGSHLAERLMERGDSVTLFDRAFTNNTSGLGCEKLVGDITNYDSVGRAVAGHQAVFHFAAVSRVAWGQTDPQKCWDTNVRGTVNVLEACRKSAKRPLLFYASSREVYGEPTYLPVDEGHPKNPKSIYGATKLSAELSCRSYSALADRDEAVNSVIFRFSNVYGSDRDLPERVIPKFTSRALRGQDIELFGGDQVLDFTFVDDVVAGIFAAYNAAMDGKEGVVGEDFHFATGRGCSVSELAKMISSATGSRSRIVRREGKSFDVLRFVGDSSKAKLAFGYEPRTKLEDGLKIFVERLAPNAKAA
jgi:UDP-glucose 4-epimerase